MMFAAPMCSMAKKVPAAKTACLSDHARIEEKFRREAIVDILNYLYDEPSIVGNIRDFCKEKWNLANQQKEYGGGVETMGTTIDSYDEAFKLAFIHKKLGISHKAMGVANVQGGKIIQQIFRALLKCSGNLAVPPCLRRSVGHGGRLLAEAIRIAVLGHNLDEAGAGDQREGRY